MEYAYRNGDEIVPDFIYDALYDVYTKHIKIDPEVNKNWNSNELPITLSGLTAVKSKSDLDKWIRLKKIESDTTVIITPKYDGMSKLKNELTKQSWTGGDKTKDITDKAKLLKSTDKQINGFSIGEAIISRNSWIKIKEKYPDYKSARNLVASLFNPENTRPETIDILQYVDYIRYSFVDLKGNDKLSKIEQLELLNKLNTVQVPFVKVQLKDIDEDLINTLFNQWSIDYEIDGLVIDINGWRLRNELGRETNTLNPNYAIKYKGNFEEIKETTIVDIKTDVSKHGYINPVIEIEPIILDGATVTNVTANNFRFVDDLKLMIGTTVTVKRSGMVIPKLVDVDGFKIPYPEQFETIGEYEQAYNELKDERELYPVELPNKCPICNSELKWNENSVHLECTNKVCDGKLLKQIASFFEIIDVEEVKLSTFKTLYNAGYQSVKDIINLTVSDLMKLDGIQENKANIIYNNIHSKLKDIDINKLQHASCLFGTLGSKKLKLINENKNNVSDLTHIDGISDKSAKMYLNGINKFNDFISSLPVTIKQVDKVKLKSSKLNEVKAVFTGFRDKDLENLIIENGGEIKSTISKNVTHLVMNQKGTGSSKETKAEKLGIKIMTRDEFLTEFNL